MRQVLVTFIVPGNSHRDAPKFSNIGEVWFEVFVNGTHVGQGNCTMAELGVELEKFNKWKLVADDKV